MQRSNHLSDRCSHKKCESLKSLLQTDHSHRLWVFLRLAPLSGMVEPTGLLGYLQNALVDEEPKHFTAVVEDGIYRSFQVLLKLKTTDKPHLAVKNLRDTLVDSSPFALETSLVVPLVDCLDSFQANARIWISDLRSNEKTFGKEEVLDDFEDYVKVQLEVAEFPDLVTQTPDACL